MEDTVVRMSDHIYVTKRDGTRVPVSFNEVLSRIQKLADGLPHVNPDLVAQKVCTQIQDGIKTSELDEFAAETCAMMQARYHPNYGKLAARLVIDNHQKKTPSRLIDSAQVLFEEEARRCALTFERQFHYAIFYAYMRLREQEIRNLMWVSECVAQDQKARAPDGVVFLF